MKKIKVKLGDRSYDIFVGAGTSGEIAGYIGSIGNGGAVVVLTDENVAAKAKISAPVFGKYQGRVIRITIPAGEKSKSFAVYQKTIQEIAQKTKSESPVIVALGGGVVGDLSGFIAATLRRGVPCVQVPTTLLAQVDSSVGGKVGIDLPAAKNLVGAFYQPKAVFADTNFLKTLPKREIQCGLAEIIKYAVIDSAAFFGYLEKHIGDILSLKETVLEKVVYECLRVKARMVEEDERDNKDIRIALNFGHTLGHAIESASAYSGRYSHGEGVALGMILAGEIAVRLEMFREKDFVRMTELIKKAGLPSKVQGVRLKDILTSYGYDKKFIFGTNRFVLPRKIGKVVVVNDVPALLVKTSVKKYIG